MRIFRFLIAFVGLVLLALAIGFGFQISIATRLWPWPDGQLSYLFVGSILAAVSASSLWIAWSGEFAALAGGSLNVFVIAAASSIYLFRLGLQAQRPNAFPFAIVSLIAAVASLVVLLWSARLAFADSRAAPRLARVSFAIFLAALVLAGLGLLLGLRILPWDVNPDSSVLFGCIFLGNASYFLYGLLRPLWHNALGQLLSFLVYDAVLLEPFFQLFETVKPRYLASLVVYLVVLVSSAAMAVYLLFVNPKTRFGAAGES